jgi:hypothetical protein
MHVWSQSLARLLTHVMLLLSPPPLLMLLQYDKKHQRVGFAEADCNSIRSAPVATVSTSV